VPQITGSCSRQRRELPPHRDGTQLRNCARKLLCAAHEELIALLRESFTTRLT
jgi:hypothetical protein